MTKSFIERSVAATASTAAASTGANDINKDMVITEAMIQQACVSLDHDSELSVRVNRAAFK